MNITSNVTINASEVIIEDVYEDTFCSVNKPPYFISPLKNL